MPKMLLSLLLALGLLLSGCVSVSVRWHPGNREENERPVVEFVVQNQAEESSPATTPTSPPETTVPQTEAPTQPAPLYSAEALMKLSNEPITYGPGLAKDGNPAPYAPGAQEKYGKYGARFLEEKQDTIYLTFDCGYEYYADGKSVTGRILDVLKEKNVKAIFFVTGDYVKNNPELVQRMLDEGHALGNHSMNHKLLPQLTLEEMEAEILSLHNTVKDTFGYTMKFFRPPEGSFSLRSLALTQMLGYETVHWSFAYADWNIAEQPDPETAREKILSCHHDGAIYLLHAISTTNAQVLGEVIDGFRAMGYGLEQLK